jgi:hypothetical protein
VNEKSRQIELGTFRPSNFMRKRKPFLFSDTQVFEETLLDRSLLDHHLETLTNRSQEKDFEHFSKRLAEKELCPNLLPQTGPTGGGDSKVDSETYPVSDAVSLLWYEGIGREAASERWAFAISAKRQWRQKVKSDVQGIVETQRGYTLIYFISSHYIKDKDRASIEDEFLKRYNVKVRLLDRTWILDKVFQNKREQLAVETLKISTRLTETLKKGSLDVERESELNELEKEIQDSTRYQGIKYQLIEDCIQAAILSRLLELPRVEVEGRFARAERVAEQYGTDQQKLRCAYEKALTLFWWYDDFRAFNLIYDDIERLAIGSSQVTDIELLANLWHLLWAALKNSQLTAAAAKLELRTKALRAALLRLQAEKDRPSTSIQSRSIELLINLSEFQDIPAKLSEIIDGFSKIIEEIKSLVNFPVIPLIKVLSEVGKYLPDDSGFDELFESMLLLSKERESRATSGRMLLERGKQKLHSGRYYEAICLLGRAQNDLATHECLNELVAALALCGRAYESIGLLWAARSNTLLAASLVFNKFWEDSTITINALICLQRLIWIELQLGQVPIALAWIEMATAIVNVIKLNTEKQEKFNEERKSQDLFLGFLILKSAFRDLFRLEAIPRILEDIGLHHSFLASLYALGYEDTLRDEGWIPKEEDESSVRQLFNDWTDQSTASNLPKTLEFLSEDLIEFHSQVLGCNIFAEVPNNNRSVFIAQSILASLEAFLATSLDSDLIPHQSNIRFKVMPSDSVDSVIGFYIQEESSAILETIVEVQHSVNESYVADLNSEAFKKKLYELFIRLVTCIAYLPDPQKYFDRLLGEELAFSRALNFTSVATSIWNILGKTPKIRLEDWKLRNVEKHFQLRRTTVWNSEKSVNDIRQTISVKPKPDRDALPQELRDVTHPEHRDRKVYSLINKALWDKAGWKGTGFGFIPNEKNLPLLEFALFFDDKSIGKKIFSQWREELGDTDIEERIRVSIITGIDADNPFAYRVVIGINPDWIKASSESRYIMTYRIRTMEPRDSSTLNQFVQFFQELGFYILVPGYVSEDSSNPEFFWKSGIMKRQIFIRPAWQLGENDCDLCGVQVDDKIIIPENVQNPPIINALSQIRKMKSR